jgi:hypothetical protein
MDVPMNSTSHQSLRMVSSRFFQRADGNRHHASCSLRSILLAMIPESLWAAFGPSSGRGTPHANGKVLCMAGRRITVVADFETLIARAGFTKGSLARAAKVNRGVIFRAINPRAYGVGGTLRNVTAWNIAQAYAERADMDRESAFARLFVVTGDPQLGGPIMDLDTPEHVVHPQDQEASAVHSTALKQTATLRLDAESLAMLDALMQEEDRGSQRDMIRVLIKRAYRALVARRSTSDSTLRGALSFDDTQEETP